MIVERLRLRNFRNIQDATIEPDRHLNLLFGDNAQGKTSVLEALSFLATLRSFRGARPADVVRRGQEHADVDCTVRETDKSGSVWQSELHIHFEGPGRSRNGRKIAAINGKTFRSSTEYLSQRFRSSGFGIHTTVFNPADHELVRGEPKLRREYLNRVIAAENEDYMRWVSSYRKVLDQKNALLKDERRRDREVILTFTGQLAELAAKIARYRLKWLKSLEEKLQEILPAIAPQQPLISVTYSSAWMTESDRLISYNNNLGLSDLAGQPTLPPLEELEQAFWLKYSTVEDAEYRQKRSLCGPHRDDWFFSLEGQELKARGSQGEVRSALLALKLAEIDLFREHTGVRPIFLLDDFSSELDRQRRVFLMRFIEQSDLQVFVTTTEGNLFEGKKIHVVGGSLTAFEEDEQAPKEG